MFIRQVNMRAMRIIRVLVLLMAGLPLSAQNINVEWQRTTMYRYPLHPLDKSLKTYSVSIQELGSFLDRSQKDTIDLYYLILPGYEKVKAGGDIQIELVLSPLSVTKRELRDQPSTNEKDGVTTTFHQYSYLLTCSFPAKIRVLTNGDLVTEQDLPGFFTTEYFPKNNNSQTAIQQEYENDYSFRNRLLGDQLRERGKEIRGWLFSNYGFGFTPRLINIGHVKDKKGEYEDLNKAFSLMMTGFASADQKKEYIDEEFKNKLTWAINIYEGALKEFSTDKKARINEKVAATLHYNIALAQYGMHELDAADERLNLVKDGPRPVQTAATRLKEEIQDRRLRLMANGLMAGELPPEPTRPQVSAQKQEPEKPNYRDHIVFINGDTVDAKFIIPSGEVMQYGDSVWMQEHVIVIENGETIEVPADKIQSYSFQGVVRETFIAFDDTTTDPTKTVYKMYKRTLDGPISLYMKYTVEKDFRDPTQKYVAAYPYFKKGTKSGNAVYGNFNRGVSKLVSEYPGLSERVKNGEFQKEDLMKIVREYNEWINLK